MHQALPIVVSSLLCLTLLACGPTLHTATKTYESGAQRVDYSYYEEDDETVRHGPYREWYESGGLKVEGEYVDGKRGGEWTFYYHSGDVREAGRYEDGRRHGEWVFRYDGGELRTRGEYKFGVRIGSWDFWTADAQRHARLTYDPDAEDGLRREHFDVSGVDPEAQAQTKGSLRKSHIRLVVQAHEDELSSCYEEALRGEPKFEGRVMTKFIIGPTGAASFDEFTHNTLEHPSAEACIEDVINTMQFNSPGGRVEVNYPFNFSLLR